MRVVFRLYTSRGGVITVRSSGDPERNLMMVNAGTCDLIRTGKKTRALQLRYSCGC